MNNYQKHLQEMKDLSGRPSLLLHVCCGVCSVYPLSYLKDHFDITVYFANSNIFPYEEYEKRLLALCTYLDILNDPDIKIIVPAYDNEAYTKELSLYDDHQEGGRRCYHCYEMRMREAYAYADENGYDYFTTVMSISNRKNADYINEIGETLQKQFNNTKYLHADFKKDGGIGKNEEMNKKLGLYHQDYCGCVYSMR